MFDVRLGTIVAEKKLTCFNFTAFTTGSKSLNWAFRIYASGERNHVMTAACAGSAWGGLFLGFTHITTR